MASGKKSTKSKKSSARKDTLVYRVVSASRSPYVMCVDDGGRVDLQVRKIYKARPKPSEMKLGLLRVVDDSGDDYLYPKSWFVPLRISPTLGKQIGQLQAEELAQS